MPTAESQKKAFLKWIEKNKDKYINSMKESKQKWRNENREIHLIKNAEYSKKSYDKWNTFKKEAKRLRLIIAE